MAQSRKEVKRVDQEEELRLGEHDVKLTNQSIVELAYLTKKMIEISYGQKLFSKQADCYKACFYHCRNLLRTVDENYLRKHRELIEFYKAGRELSNDSDRLSWV